MAGGSLSLRILSTWTFVWPPPMSTTLILSSNAFVFPDFGLDKACPYKQQPPIFIV